MGVHVWVIGCGVGGGVGGGGGGGGVWDNTFARHWAKKLSFATRTGWAR